MKRHRAGQVGPPRGFTLMELIIVIVILAIAATGIASLQGRIFSRQKSVMDLQVGTKLMQDCAEQILGTRRYASGGYLSIDTPTFSLSPASCGVTSWSPYSTPTVTLTDLYTGVGCPTNPGSNPLTYFDCKLAKISQNGMSDLTLLLVDY